MSKHCDFCFAQIDKDEKAVVVRQDYIMLLGLTEHQDRMILDKKIELCRNCHQHFLDALADLFKRIYDHLDKATQQLFDRFKSSPKK